MRKSSGISLLILIFLSLSLITFSLLSLSGAMADLSLSQKMADRTTAYYSADCKAHQLLSKIDQTLLSCFLDSQERTDPKKYYFDSCLNSFSKDEFKEWFTQEDISLFSFSVPIDTNQILQVKLRIQYPELEEESMYQIVSWNIINTRTWHADNHINLYQPE